MTQSDYKLLLEVLSIETHSKEEGAMIEFLLGFFAKNGIKAWKDAMGNVYAEKGEIGNYQKYPLVVAHTDTVHRIHKKKIIPKKLLLPNYAGELKPALKGFDANDKQNFLRSLPIMRVLFKERTFNCLDDVRIVPNTSAPL